MTRIEELKQKRGALVKEARTIIDRCDTEKRDMNAEENVQYDKTMEDVDKLGGDITREERLLSIETGLRDNPAAQPPAHDDPEKEQRAAFTKYLRSGNAALGENEIRALQADVDTIGGYLAAPQQFISQLLKNVDDAVVIRQLATVIPLASAESLGVPTLDTDLSDADWTTELATGKEDTSMKFGKRELRPHPFAKRIKVSSKLLRSSTIDVEALVRDRLAYKFGVTQEKAFMTGSGKDQPLGVFTPSKDGISKSRDIIGANTATSISADGLVDAKYALKGQYLNAAKWIFHRDALAQIRKLKDSTGQYLWQPGISGGIPDRIIELPYVMSEYAPNTFTKGMYAGILGDFSKYWIVDALNIQIQRLVELYAEANQTGFIGRVECDGAPVLEEAFVRVTLGQ